MATSIVGVLSLSVDSPSARNNHLHLVMDTRFTQPWFSAKQRHGYDIPGDPVNNTPMPPPYLTLGRFQISSHALCGQGKVFVFIAGNLQRGNIMKLKLEDTASYPPTIF